jgi:hypothetical protein
MRRSVNLHSTHIASMQNSRTIPNTHARSVAATGGTIVISENDQESLKTFLKRVGKVAPLSSVDITAMSYGTHGFLLGAFRGITPMYIGLHLGDARRTPFVNEAVICDDIMSLEFWPSELRATPRQTEWSTRGRLPARAK